jgi:soluble lytic murein transglycosylase-like protein
MLRLNPEVRALCANARRSADRLLVEARGVFAGSRPTLIRWGLSAALIVPAGAMMAAGRYEQVKEHSAELKAAPLAEDPAVTEAWMARVTERERHHIAAGFAEEFNIDVDLARRIQAAAEVHEIEPQVAFGLVKAESTFRTRAVSPAGAVGLTQLMPATARGLKPGVTRAQLMDPEINLELGFRYLRELLDRYDGDTRLALTAYNRGPGTVARQIRAGRNPDNGYADMVLEGHSAKHVALMNRKFGGRR